MQHGGDLVSHMHHNRLRYVLLESCRQTCLSPHIETESVLSHEAHRTRPTDILIPHWDMGKPAAFDLTNTSMLNSRTLCDSWTAALAAEVCKHNSNDAKCSELDGCVSPLQSRFIVVGVQKPCRFFHALQFT